jgi:hypothetical protein
VFIQAYRFSRLQTGFQSSANAMAPNRVLKKVEGTVESTCIEGDFIADTTPHAIDSIKSWRQIFENLDYEIKNILHDSENKVRDIAESELQKIAACP